MDHFRKPRSLFFPLLLIAVGLLFFLVNIGRVEGTTWDNLLKYWPVILIIWGLDGFYKQNGWVGPLVMLGLGVILLLGNLGVIEQNAFTLLLRLWPVLLVAVGLDIAFGRQKSVWSTLLRIATGLALVAGIFWLAMISPVSANPRSVPFEQSLDNATSSSLSMEVTVGKLDLTGGAASSQLVAGTAGLASESDLDVNYKKPVDGKSSLSLEGNPISFLPVNAGAYPWAIKVNSTLPIDVSVRQAVGIQTLDLQPTLVEDVTTQLAVGTITLTLPQGADFSGKVDCAVCQVILRIPKGSNVNIDADTAVVSVNIPQNYHRSGSSIEYLAGSGNKVNLEVNIAVGSLIIEEY